jgi:predicted amidohydrolase
MSRTLRIGIHQAEPGSGVTVQERDAYRKAGVEILVLPEYFWVRPGDRDHQDAGRHYEEDLEGLGYLTQGEDWVVVGGSMVEPGKAAFHNACPVFYRGKELGRYRKIHLMPGEARHGITPGADFVVLEALGLRLAPVICADVLYQDTFERIAALDSDVILAPMSSPFRPDDTPRDKDTRDREIFLRGAASAHAPIVKAGGTGHLFGRPLQGRCLVATPDTFVFRTPFEEETARHAWVVDVPVGR